MRVSQGRLAAIAASVL